MSSTTLKILHSKNDEQRQRAFHFHGIIVACPQRKIREHKETDPRGNIESAKEVGKAKNEGVGRKCNGSRSQDRITHSSSGFSSG